jgi:transposase
LRRELAALQAQVRQLQEKLAAAQKDSSTSSKPPSSDIVKPAKPAADPDTGPRRPGGQPGHAKHERPLIPAELLQFSHNHVLACCPDCGHDLEPTEQPPRIIQQIDIDLREIPVHAEEHRAYGGFCPHCRRYHQAALPESIARGGLVGPRLTTLIAYLKGVCHASFSTIRKFLRDVVGVTLSRGQLAKVIGKVSQALEGPYEELLQGLPDEAALNVDETGHKENGLRMWTWCFRASLYTVFHIDPRRSGDVLLEVLGEEFQGVLGCDYFSAYRRYMGECDIIVQFCLAHLIRDVKFLLTLPDQRDRAYGERLCVGLRQLFGAIHRRDEMGARRFQAELRGAKQAILRAALEEVPPTRHSTTLAKRFAKHGEAYFTFLTSPGVEPTNNVAEQAIRFVVLDRQVTQGTRGETGRQWCERIWTVMATCWQQGRSVFTFLSDAVQAWMQGEPAPSLAPTS